MGGRGRCCSSLWILRICWVCCFPLHLWTCCLCWIPLCCWICWCLWCLPLCWSLWCPWIFCICRSPCLWICCFSLFLWIRRIFWIHWLPLCCPWCLCLWCLPLLGIRRNVFFFKKFMKRKVFILCPSIKSKTVMNFIFNILFRASDYLSSATLLSL